MRGRRAPAEGPRVIKDLDGLPVTQTTKRDLGGTLRARDASSTLAWVRPLLPHFGITRIANITGLDRIGIPVWICVRPNGRALSVSQGKGIDAELAQASAVMESIELYHAERLAEPDMVMSHRAARRRFDVVDPKELMPGVRWPAYHATREIAWIRGTHLGSGEPVLVPHVRLDMNFSQPHRDAGLLFVTTTGLASGNNRLEAVSHAILEVVERDSEWRWERWSDARKRARRVNPDTVDAPMLRRLLDQLANAGVVTNMWDLTSEVGIPTYRCTIRDPRWLGGCEAFSGTGCHLSSEIALSRAITEAVQSRLTFIVGSRDDLFPESYQRSTDPLPQWRDGSGAFDFRQRRSLPLGSTFEDDLRETLRRLDDAGFRQVIAVEHTKPEFGVPVVSIIIPGMRETRD